MTLLQIEHLYKEYPLRSGEGTFQALSDINFTLTSGEVLGIIGESGSGKTTLARTILRLIEPSSGKIIFDGVDLLTLSFQEMKEMRRHIQVVFQNPALSLNPRKIIGDLLLEVLYFHKLADDYTTGIMIAETMLQKVGLHSGFLARYPHELSIGQSQRVAIARALCVNPKLLILDECVSALDISVQAQILNLLQTLQEELQISYLFISHDLTVVEHLADQVIVMDRGKIVEQGDPVEIFYHPKEAFTKKLVNARLPE